MSMKIYTQTITEHHALICYMFSKLLLFRELLKKQKWGFKVMKILSFHSQLMITIMLPSSIEVFFMKSHDFLMNNLYTQTVFFHNLYAVASVNVKPFTLKLTWNSDKIMNDLSNSTFAPHASIRILNTVHVSSRN